MKNFKLLKVVITLIVLFFIAISCSTTKKSALSCPEPASRYSSNSSLNHDRNDKRILAASHRESKGNYSFNKHISKPNINKTFKILDGINRQPSSSPSTQSEIAGVSNKTEVKTNLYAEVSINNITNEEVNAPNSISEFEVADFKNNEAIYERADIIPTNVLGLGIDYLNTYEIISPFTTTQMVTIPQEYILAPPKVEGLSLAGMIVGLVGLLILPLLFGTVGLVLSLIGLRRIKKNPDKYKGKGFAYAGIIIGCVNIVWAILVLSGVIVL